jgi:hypothetical protein
MPSRYLRVDLVLGTRARRRCPAAADQERHSSNHARFCYLSRCSALSPDFRVQKACLHAWHYRDASALTAFLVITLGLSWLIFCVPVLAFYDIIPGANLDH